MTPASAARSLVAEWNGSGSRVPMLDHEVFVVDVPAEHDGGEPPLLVLHGFPTSSIDFAAVLPALRSHRRVVCFDFLGFGLSDKPDRRYSLFEQADLVEAVAARAELDRVDLLTHDMGDSVGGEILARSLDGQLPFEIERRVLTNGSIYIEMAQLTDGQNLLLSLPDERMPDDLGFDAVAIGDALRAIVTVHDASVDDRLQASAELVVHDEGVRLLPRLIRYIEERRLHESRWTGAIERHPAPLHVVWGLTDPIAVAAMVDALEERRPATSVDRLDDVGHFPMIEVPDRFADSVLAGLS